MNRITYTFVITLIVLFSGNAFAQKNITEEDLRILLRNAYAEIGKRANRQESTVEQFNDRNRPETFRSFTKTIFVPPDAKHIIDRVEDKDGIREEQTISIGNKIYIKKHGEAWEVKQAEKREEGSGNRFTISGVKESPRAGTTIEFIDDAKLGDLSVKIFILIVKYKHSSDRGEFVSTLESKYWFNEDNLLLRSETVSYRNLSNALLRTTTTYEYDPDIKIKAPTP